MVFGIGTPKRDKIWSVCNLSATASIARGPFINITPLRSKCRKTASEK